MGGVILSLPFMALWHAQGRFAFYLHITRSFAYPKSIVNSVTFDDCLQVILSVIKSALY